MTTQAQNMEETENLGHEIMKQDDSFTGCTITIKAGEAPFDNDPPADYPVTKPWTIMRLQVSFTVDVEQIDKLRDAISDLASDMMGPDYEVQAAIAHARIEI